MSIKRNITLFFLLFFTISVTAFHSNDVQAGWKTTGAIFLGAWGVKKALKSPKVREAAINHAKKHPEFKDALVNSIEDYISKSKLKPEQLSKARNYLDQIKGSPKDLQKNVDPRKVQLPRSKYPESAKHIEDAINNGQPKVLTKQTGNGAAAKKRRESLKDIPTKKGLDRDEYPPAMSAEGGKGSSVRHIKSSDNRGAGSCIGAQCRKLVDGDEFIIEIVE